MSDPTHAHGPPGDPRKAHAETRDAPAPAEPATAADGTHSHVGEPVTATGPRADGGDEPVVAPPGFEIIREVGSGGMGIVYEARQLRLNRRVALKVLRGGRGDAKDIIRFLTEAEAVAAVRHPHVVQVHEFGQDQGRPFMVLELLEGGTLSDRLKEGARLEARAAAELVEKLAGAVQAMHDLGIVHRDLKPSNVLFSEGVPKITDFGLAKRDGGTDLTKTQAVMGTPAYMAPEQAKGDAKFVGPPADIYALGVILYECLTGKRPFDADDTWAVLQKVIHAEPEPPRRHAPGLSRDLELIALKCLEKDPAARYPTAGALAADLQAFLAGKPVSVRPAGRSERLVKWARRNPAIAGFSAALLVVGLLGFAGVTWALLKAEARGKELAKSNDDLNASLGDLTVSRTALSDSMNDVKRAQADAEERGYLSEVGLAHQLWKSNDLVGMRAALERCPKDRRKWEWYYLDRLTRSERAIHQTDSVPLALAYSPDGRFLAYCTLAGTLEVRDVRTDKVLFRKTSKRTGENFPMAFHPGGKELAFAVGGQLFLINLESWQLTEPQEVNSASYLALCYTSGSLLGAARVVQNNLSSPAKLIVRDILAGTTISSFPAWQASPGLFADISGAAFSPDGSRFAANAIDSGLRTSKGDGPEPIPTFNPIMMVWDVKTGKLLSKTEGGSSRFASIAFSADNQSVAMGRRGQIAELDLRPNIRASVLPGPTGEITAVAFDRNNLIWSGGEEKLISARDRTSQEERFSLKGCRHAVWRLAVSPDGKELAAAVGDVASRSGAVYRYNLSALGADTWRSSGTRNRIQFVAAVSPDGKRFAAGDYSMEEDASKRLFVIRDVAGTTEQRVQPAKMWLRGCFRPDGVLLALDMQDHVQVIHQDGQIAAEIGLPKATNRFIPALVLSAPDSRAALVIDGDVSRPERTALRSRMVWLDTEKRTTLRTTELDFTSVLPANSASSFLIVNGAALDREGKRIAIVFAATGKTKDSPGRITRGILSVCDFKTGTELFRRVTDEPLRAVTFDEGGRVIAGGGSSAGGVIVGWEIESGKEFLSLRGHTQPILCLTVGPGGRLATGGADRVVKLWDIPSLREIMTLDGFAQDVVHVTFTNGGLNLVAATGFDVMETVIKSPNLATLRSPAEVRVFRGPHQ